MACSQLSIYFKVPEQVMYDNWKHRRYIGIHLSDADEDFQVHPKGEHSVPELHHFFKRGNASMKTHHQWKSVYAGSEELALEVVGQHGIHRFESSVDQRTARVNAIKV